MIVVADSSPFVALLNIDQISVLPAMFQEVIAPPQVISELHSANRPAAVRAFAQSLPSWLIERNPVVIEEIAALHAGEIAAISLARELNADLLLIDELRGRKAAAERGISLTGTIGVLELAATRGLLDLAIAFDRLKQTDFWISHDLLDARLSRFLSSRKP